MVKFLRPSPRKGGYEVDLKAQLKEFSDYKLINMHKSTRKYIQNNHRIEKLEKLLHLIESELNDRHSL